TSEITHDGRTIFRGVPQRFTATRYHSLVVRRTDLPRTLEVSAHTADGTIMGLRHRQLPIEGVQFHPESVLTEAGFKILHNFLALGLRALSFSATIRIVLSSCPRARDFEKGNSHDPRAELGTPLPLEVRQKRGKDFYPAPEVAQAQILVGGVLVVVV